MTDTYENNSYGLVESVMIDTVSYYLRTGRSASSETINNGLCVEFAEDVVARLRTVNPGTLKNIDTLSEDELKNDDDAWCEERMQDYGAVLPDDITLNDLAAYGNTGYHMWVHVDGKHYDAECTVGLDNPFHLPFYRRIFDTIRKTKGVVK